MPIIMIETEAVKIKIPPTTLDKLKKLAEHFGVPIDLYIRSALIDHISLEGHRVAPPPPVYEWMTR